MTSTRRLASTWHGLVADESPAGAAAAVVLSGRVQPGEPAESAGFKPGDHVVRPATFR
ncbi:MAG: hypothetical protein U0835_07565 [Isosphaeraceae bacterium]